MCVYSCLCVQEAVGICICVCSSVLHVRTAPASLALSCSEAGVMNAMLRCRVNTAILICTWSLKKGSFVHSEVN